MNARGRAAGLAANLLLSLVSLVVFVGLAEGLARGVDLRPRSSGVVANPPWLGGRWLVPSDDYRDRLADAGFLSRYYDLYEWDRFLFYRLRPGRRLEMIDPLAPPSLADHGRWLLETNARGFRGADFDPQPVPGRHRIVSLGDSSTFGWGVAVDQAYPSELRDDVARRLGSSPDRLEVLNLGVPGYSSFQGRVMLERVALPLRPELVTWSYLSNDGAFTGQSDRRAYERRLGWSGALLAALHHSRAFEAFEGWFDLLSARLSGAARGTAPRTQRNVASYQEAAENVRDAVRAARAAGVKIVLVGLCLRDQGAATLAAVAAETATPYVDATALLDERVPRLASDPASADVRASAAARYGSAAVAAAPYLLAFLPDGCHPNAYGHRLVAQALAERVAPLLGGEARSSQR